MKKKITLEKLFSKGWKLKHTILDGLRVLERKYEKKILTQNGEFRQITQLEKDSI